MPTPSLNGSYSSPDIRLIASGSDPDRMDTTTPRIEPPSNVSSGVRVPSSVRTKRSALGLGLGMVLLLTAVTRRCIAGVLVGVAGVGAGADPAVSLRLAAVFRRNATILARPPADGLPSGRRAGSGLP
jgi:hypothetical protein